VFVLDEWAAEYGKAYAELDLEDQSRLRGRLEKVFRTNTHDASTGVVRLDPVRKRAFESLAAHYADVFSNGNTNYSIPRGA
jgi:nitric oxide reductase large subunit